jgi:hypothetical protein
MCRRAVVAEMLPALEYNDSSGWSGGDSSQDRADFDDTSGRSKARQEATLKYLALMEGTGATYKELGSVLGLHHGQISSVLTNLHKAGLVTRLKARRLKCEIYTLPNFATGETAPYKSNSDRGITPKQFNEIIDAVRQGFHNSGSILMTEGEIVQALRSYYASTRP